MEFDEIGYWSEIKLDIIREYAHTYTKIMTSQCQKGKSFYYMYIDAFSGAGIHISKTRGEFVDGSPIVALNITFPFKKYFFIDLKGKKISCLQEKINKDYNHVNVELFSGDCNVILPRDIFPQCRYDEYKRALCILDPYGLHLNWEVIVEAARTRTIEIFLNFPIMDMNRNVIWRKNPENVKESNIERMNQYWGDDSWREIAYQDQYTLFGNEKEKTENIVIAQSFRQRMLDVAGFKYVSEPLPMRNSNGSIIYYLFFAAHKPVADSIVNDIFNKYRNRGIR